MRNELTLIELADRYLRGELNTTERAELEERMLTNAELRELVEDHRTLLGGMQRLALRPAVDKAYRSYRFGKWAPGIGGAVVAAMLISGSALLMTGGRETAPPDQHRDRPHRERHHCTRGNAGHGRCACC